jgi:hypothetical protein
MGRPGLRRRVLMLVVGALVGIVGFVGAPAGEADELPPFCGYVRPHVFTTTSTPLVWYCDRIAHPNCDAFPAVGPSNVIVADFFVCSNI